MNSTMGGRLIAVGVLVVSAALSGALYTHMQMGSWEKNKSIRDVAALTDRMAGRARNPDNFKTADEKYGSHRIASYVVGGVGLIFIAVGWSMGAGARKPD